MKRTLFELLRARPINDAVDIESLEKQYGVILPPKYKLFAQTFYLGEKQIHREQYYNAKYKDYFDCSAYIYTPFEDVGFQDFNSVKRSFEIWASGGLSDRHYEKQLFPLGGGDWGGISVGLTNEFKDKIVMNGYDIYNVTIVCEDIFEFVRGVEVLDLEEDFMYGVKYSQLHKNWGEDFWRVKEN